MTRTRLPITAESAVAKIDHGRGLADATLLVDHGEASRAGRTGSRIQAACGRAAGCGSSMAFARLRALAGLRAISSRMPQDAPTRIGSDLLDDVSVESPWIPAGSGIDQFLASTLAALQQEQRPVAQGLINGSTISEQHRQFGEKAAIARDHHDVRRTVATRERRRRPAHPRRSTGGAAASAPPRAGRPPCGWSLFDQSERESRAERWRGPGRENRRHCRYRARAAPGGQQRRSAVALSSDVAPLTDLVQRVACRSG